jgi:hypothetical protein
MKVYIMKKYLKIGVGKNGNRSFTKNNNKKEVLRMENVEILQTLVDIRLLLVIFLFIQIVSIAFKFIKVVLDF